MIRIRVTGNLFQNGSYAKAYFENYFEDFGKVDGIDSIVNEGVNSMNQMVFSIHVSKGSIDKVYGGGTISVDMNCTSKVPVSSISNGADIVFLVKGKISGLSSKGHAFIGSIRDTLQDSFSCPWIKDGIIDMHIPDSQKQDGYIDFVGNDGCSNVIWYYYHDSSFKVYKNKNWLKN
jgi:hypothetical protein